MSRTPYEIILSKRNGERLATEDIRYLVQTYTREEVPDYQMAALLMAVFFRGMDFRETTDLTLSMRDSGAVFDLSPVRGVKVDKHSTGGVGDKISLILAPLAASVGVVVPMISGRGLGHTGGTLDKLEAIPGFNVRLSSGEFMAVLKRIGVCMIGQTDEVAPADKKLYALRDVTATIESIPLISASIMSKKLAAGIDGLVLDVKVGSGAFMKNLHDATALAKSLIAIGTNAGVAVRAVLTDMSEPLGSAVGNWVEVRESIDALKGNGPADVEELTVELASHMLMLADPDVSPDTARARCRQHLRNGMAFEKFRQMVEAQGGDLRYIDDPDRYPACRHEGSVRALQDGFVLSIDTEAIGLAGIVIKAGRRTKEDAIDHAAGIMIVKKVGDRVTVGEELARIYGNDPDSVDEAQRRVSGAFRIDFNAPEKQPLILNVLDKKQVEDLP